MMKCWFSIDGFDAILSLEKESATFNVSSKANKLDSFCDYATHELGSLKDVDGNKIIDALK